MAKGFSSVTRQPGHAALPQAVPCCPVCPPPASASLGCLPTSLPYRLCSESAGKRRMKGEDGRAAALLQFRVPARTVPHVRAGKASAFSMLRHTPDDRAHPTDFLAGSSATARGRRSILGIFGRLTRLFSSLQLMHTHWRHVPVYTAFLSPPVCKESKSASHDYRKAGLIKANLREERVFWRLTTQE